MKFCEISEKEFSKFEANNSYGNFMQSVERGSLREKMGFSSYFLGLKDGEKIVGVGLLVEKDGEAWVQMGPILDWEDRKIVKRFLEGIVEFSKEKGFLRLEIYPPVLLSIRDMEGKKTEEFKREKLFDVFSKIGFKYKGETVETDFKALRWMFVKDLSGFKDMREVELSFNASTRKKLHQTQRELDVRQVTEKAELKNWIKPLQESNERNGIKTRDLKYFEDMWDTFGEKVMFIEAVKKDTGEIVASEVDVWHKNELVAFLAGMIEKFKKENGVTAIKGWQMEKCLEKKQKRLNLYGVDGVFSMDNPLLRTKSGFSGVVEEYIGGFIMTIRPVKYVMMKIKRKLKR